MRTGRRLPISGAALPFQRPLVLPVFLGRLTPARLRQLRRPFPGWNRGGYVAAPISHQFRYLAMFSLLSVSQGTV